LLLLTGDCRRCRLLWQIWQPRDHLFGVAASVRKKMQGWRRKRSAPGQM